MQTYLVSILLRTITSRVGLLFCLLLLLSTYVCATDPADNNSKDSLYGHWAKSKSTLPTLFYELTNFNDYAERVEVESLIRMYGIGGVVIPNGGQHQLNKWLSNNQLWRNEPILHVAKVEQIFELPFDGLPDYPTQLEVECWTDDSLVFWLGQAHAVDLKQMGFGMVQFSDLPTYYTSHELKKVDLYLQGIASQQMNYSFGKQASQFLNRTKHFPQQKPEVLNLSQISDDGMIAKKQIKDYRREAKDKRIVWAYASDNESSLQQVERGLGLLVLPKSSKPQTIINSMLVENIPTKKYYKGQVKKYFNLLNKSNPSAEPVEQKPWTKFQDDVLSQSITLIQDPKQLLPLAELSDFEIYVYGQNEAFKEKLDKYKKSQWLPSESLIDNLDSVVYQLPNNAIVLADLTGLNDEELETQVVFFDSLNAHRPVILLQEGNQDFVSSYESSCAVIWNPNPNLELRQVMLEMVFGVFEIQGQLPGYYQKDNNRKGIAIKATQRLSYLPSKERIVDQEILSQIDTLVTQAIKEEMMPGGQIMMVKDGQVVYDKSFGFLTYDSLTPVRWDHVYDIASVTKTVATVPALMHRMEQGQLKIDRPLGDYLTDIDSTKAHLELGDVLTHQSGLKSYIPFWRNAEYFTDSANFLYKERKRRNRYVYHAINWNDSIQSWIGHSRYNSLSNKDGTYRYLYSDLGFMLMKDVVEEGCKCMFDDSLNELLYDPMGMNLTTFNPLNKIPQDQIAPTEQDKYFRSELLRGVVHDKNAALLGGVSGHAGLFSNANDLAKYMQMLIQGGYYGGVQYFSDSVVQVFTSKKNEADRRAMGWDKPDNSVGNASKYASELSYGHSGFTGTLVWADPKYNLVYIFLSNRIYPDPQNYKLIRSNIRTKIHDLMYESFLNLEAKKNQGS